MGRLRTLGGIAVDLFLVVAVLIGGGLPIALATIGSRRSSGG